MRKNIYDKDFGYNILKPIVDWNLKHSYRKVEVRGKENIPTDGAVLIAPNHCNTLMDALVILRAFDNETVFGARADMFNNATLIVTPYTGTDIGMMNALSMFFKKLGFARLQVATDAEHDQMIAYTSQLAHVVSSAYIKSELSPNFKGFSAGSFHDLQNSDEVWQSYSPLLLRLQVYS